MALLDFLPEEVKRAARFILPEFLEKPLGVEKPPAMEFPIVPGEAGEKGKRALLGISEKRVRAEGAQIRQEFTADPKTLKDEIREVIKRDIQTGVLDKTQIRNDVKAYINQKINTNILKKTALPEPRSIGGFLENAGQDVKELVEGIGALMGIGAKAGKKLITDPIESSKAVAGFTGKVITSPQYREEIKETYIQPIIEEYKEYRNPMTKIYEDPLDVFLDATAVFSGGATIAGKVGLKTAEKALRVGAEAASIKKLGTATKFVLNKMPGGPEVIENISLASKGRKLITKEQLSFLASRNRLLNEIDKTIRKLPADEVKALPLTIEGFSRPPKGASLEFQKAVGLVRSLAKDQERFGLKVGKLTPDIIERRKFQPLAKFLEREGKLELKVPYESRTGRQLRGTIDKIKKFFPDADPIYMRHFFTDDPKKFSVFFLNTKPVRSFKPGFLKKSYGKEGYIGAEGKITKAQLKEILGRQATENLKWQRNIQLLERVKAMPEVKPYKKGAKLLPGHSIFAPDGLIRFYKGTIDLAEEMQKKLGDDVWETFRNAVETTFPKQKTYIGLGRAKLYQVPDALAQQLTSFVQPTNPWVKIIWDQPTDAFRFAVLGLFPRWNFNNIIGNTIFSIIRGDIFNPKAYLLQHQARKAGLIPDYLFAGIHRAERTTSGKLGSAAELPLVKSTIAIHDAILDTRVVGQLVRATEKMVSIPFKPLIALGNLSFRLNSAVDDMFKGAALVNRALKEDRKGFLARMVASWDDTRKTLEKVGKETPKMDDLIDNVHNWYYSGLNLTDFERRVVRRVIPFYSWMRWITTYSYRVTTETPIRANIIKNIARDFYAFTGQNKLPDYLRGSVPIGTDEDGSVYYLSTRGMNPFSTLNEIMSEGVLGAFAQGFTPAIKTAIEQTTGEEFFSGRPFTREDIFKSFSGRLYRFDPELGKVTEVPGKLKPALLENLLRNYIPQYLLMEVMLTGGARRYTAEGLDTILFDLFKDPKEREAIIKDIITKQPQEQKDLLLEAGKALGVNIQKVEPIDAKKRQEALEQATSALKNKQLPILNPNFRALLKEKIMQEIAKGTPKKEIGDRLREWIGFNVQELQKIR